MNMARRQKIEQLLQDTLCPVELRVKDQSHLHAGHAGAADGRGHYEVHIVAPAFDGLPRIKRHQLVYDALAPMLKTDIHALKIQALAPHETVRQPG